MVTQNRLGDPNHPFHSGLAINAQLDDRLGDLLVECEDSTCLSLVTELKEASDRRAATYEQQAAAIGQARKASV